MYGAASEDMLDECLRGPCGEVQGQGTLNIANVVGSRKKYIAPNCQRLLYDEMFEKGHSSHLTDLP